MNALLLRAADRASRGAACGRGRWCVFSRDIGGPGLFSKKAARRTYRGPAVPVA